MVQRSKKALTGRAHNPVPPSSANRRIHQAGDLYEQFTGHKPGFYDKIEHKPIDVAANIGYVDFIGYTTVRDGETEKYIHRFKKKSRPTLIADHDGAQIGLIGGDYNFTDRGIVDN